MSQIILLLDILTAIVTLAFGVFMLSRSQGRGTYYSFALTQFGVSAWAVSLVLVILGIGPIDPPGRLAFSFLIFSIGAFCWFITEFPKPIQGSKYWKGFIALATTIFFFIPLLPSFVRDITVINWTITGKLSPTLFPAWTLYYTFALAFSIILLIARATTSTGVERARLVQLAFGFTLFLAGHGSTNILLPFIFADFRWNNLGPVWILVLLPFMVTAILRYRLLNIRWIISKSILIPITSVIVTSCIGVISYLLSRLIAPEIALILTAILATLMLHPLVHGLEGLLNSIFKRGRMANDEIIDRVFSLARSEIDIAKFSQEVQHIIVDGIGAKISGLVVFSLHGSKILHVSNNGIKPGFERLVSDMRDVAMRTNFGIIEAEELRWRMEYDSSEHIHQKADKKLWEQMNTFEIDIGVPMVMENKIIAMLLLGRRSMDRVLQNDEVKLLSIIQQGIAPAIANTSRFAEMQELYSRLKEADQLKSQFVDVVSHQFRTPLSSIRWNVEMLQEGKSRLTKEATGMLSEVQTNASFLINTLGLLVDVIELESVSGETARHARGSFSSSELQPMLDTYAKRASDKDISFHTEISDIPVLAEKRYVEQALRQLLDNAIEYTPEKGSIHVYAVRSNGNISISVKDTGIGMSTKDVKMRAFTKLYRGKNAIQVHPDGIGLGLYLVKLIAQKSGGDATLVSSEGKGTTVTMVLPVSKVKAHLK